ncbi:MAG: iron-containing alcohol dehydrogenase [Kiritimatiellae bacterium]|nr:iron-containing alcohol dehydrogenase [Kiritimatiellia bacterium]
MARFTLPRDLYFGPGAMNELTVLGKTCKRAMVVTGGSSMQKSGALDRLNAILEKAGLEVAHFEGVEPDPSVETVMKGAKAMEAFGPDVIVAIGGGSPIDAAKAMWVFYEYPELTFDDIKTPFTMPVLRKKAIFVAVPSTSGTATEVTAFSVITDYSSKVKYPLADYEITPDIAVVDSDLAETMPPKLTAHTGLDALTHAIEAYVAALHSDFSDPLALKAIQMIDDDLVASYNGDMAARGRMHVAQCLAGMAFTNALLGITHSIAHKIGAQFNLPHGLCNAILQPYVIQFNRKACEARYAAIARALGLPGVTDRQLVNVLVDKICALNDSLDIPATLEEAGVSEDVFIQNLEFISKNAELDPCTGANPRQTTAADIEKILKAAYNGSPMQVNW